MTTVCSSPMAIALAVTKDISQSSLPALLALQRAEEPQSSVRIHEISPNDLYPGLSSGRFNVALALEADARPGWASEPLWHDELALALPLRSPLLASSEITVNRLQSYNVLLWPASARSSLRGQFAELIEDAGSESTASSFELMATLVAAGYCVGIAPCSRITQSRGWGIVLRPLAGGPHRLTTELLRARPHCAPAVERFAERAQRLAGDHLPGHEWVAGQT